MLITTTRVVVNSQDGVIKIFMTTENYKGYTINTTKADIGRSKYYFILHKEENGRLYIYESFDKVFKRVKDAHEAAKNLIDEDENENKIEWSEIY